MSYFQAYFHVSNKNYTVLLVTDEEHIPDSPWAFHPQLYPLPGVKVYCSARRLTLCLDAEVQHSISGADSPQDLDVSVQ